MDRLKTLYLLNCFLSLTSAVTHTLQYFYTAVTPAVNLPEFTIVGLVDGEEFEYYDSDIMKSTPKTEWIKKVVNDMSDYWDRQTQISEGAQEIYKVYVATAMQRFNQTGGVHTVQRMYGCELDDDGTTRGYSHYGYDGEDFISLDLNTVTYTAAKPQAVITKQRWEATGANAKFDKNYLENECIAWLQKYVEYGRDTLERKVRPKTEVFQKDSSSPVVCHATGFFPKAVMMSWQKNGEDVHEDVELRETVPNEDGSFQKRSVLTVSPEELKNNKYTCVIQHSSLEEKEIHLSDIRVLTDGGSVGIIIGAVVAALLLVLNCCVGFFISKKKSSGMKDFKQVPPDFKPVSSDGSEGSTSSLSSTESDDSQKPLTKKN